MVINVVRQCVGLHAIEGATREIRRSRITINARLNAMKEEDRTFRGPINNFLMSLAQRVDARLMGNKHHTNDYQDVTEFVQSVKNVRVPMKGRIFQGVLIIRSGIMSLFDLLRMFNVIYVTVTRNVTMRNPHLSAYPDELINVTLYDLSLASFANFKIVVRRVVTTIILARVIDRDHVNVLPNCIVRDKITKRPKDFRRRFRIRRVVGSGKAFPTAFDLPPLIYVP